MGSRATPNLRWLGALVLLGVLATACGAPTQSATETPIAEPAAGPPGTEAPPPAPNRPLCSDPDAYDRLLQLGPEPQELTLRGGEIHAFPVHLDQGQYLEINADQQGIDVYLALFGPDGERLITADRPSGRHGAEKLPWISSASGVHRVLACAWGRQAISGSYLIHEEIHHTRSPDKSTVELTKIIETAKTMAREQPKEAIRALRRASQLATELEDTEAEIEALFRIGSLQSEIQLLGEAVATYEKLSPLLTKPAHRRLAVVVLRRTATCLSQQSNHDAAENHLRSALELAEKLDDDRLTALTLGDLGLHYEYSGDITSAIRYYDHALSYWNVLDDDLSKAQVLQNRGQSYRLLGKWQLSIDDFDAALALRQEAGSQRGQAVTLAAKSMSQRGTGLLEEAEASLNKALQLYDAVADHHGRGLALTSLSVVLNESDRNQESLEVAREARDLLDSYGSKLERAIATHNIGVALEGLGRPKESKEYYQHALSDFEEIPDLLGSSITLMTLARVERELGNKVRALDLIKRAVEAVEEHRGMLSGYDLRASYLTTRRKQFDIYIDLLMELHQTALDNEYSQLALEVKEASTARSQLDALVDRSNSQGRLESLETFQLRVEIEKDITSKEGERVQLISQTAPSEKILEVEKDLRSLLRLLDQLENQDPATEKPSRENILTLPEIQDALLDNGTVLLEYHLGENSSFLWLVSEDSLSAYLLPPGHEIEQLAREAHSTAAASYKRRWQAHSQITLRKLSQVILEPVEHLIQGKETLLITGDSVLEYVPFAALPLGENSMPLGASLNIARIPSASAMAAIRARSRKNKRQAPRDSVLVLADPVFSPQDPRLSSSIARPSGAGTGDIGQATNRSTRIDPGIGALGRLNYSRNEAEAVLSFTDPSTSHALLGFDANREHLSLLDLSQFSILYFATHGELNPSHPELSRLVLSQVRQNGEPIEGFLFAHHIDDWDLNCSLVVLSACQTALGNEVKGEGLVGLPEAFLVAGSSAVLVSLWKVDDRVTSDLITRFFDYHLQHHWSPAASLMQAQKEIRQNKPQPFYWAGFVLQGEWEG